MRTEHTSTHGGLLSAAVKGHSPDFGHSPDRVLSSRPINDQNGKPPRYLGQFRSSCLDFFPQVQRTLAALRLSKKNRGLEGKKRQESRKGGENGKSARWGVGAFQFSSLPRSLSLLPRFFASTRFLPNLVENPFTSFFVWTARCRSSPSSCDPIPYTYRPGFHTDPPGSSHWSAITLRAPILTSGHQTLCSSNRQRARGGPGFTNVIQAPKGTSG